MTSAFLRPVNSLTFGMGLTPLQHVIVNRTSSGTMRQPGLGALEITAPLVALSDGIESAFVLTPREALPKVESVDRGLYGRTFSADRGLSVTLIGANSDASRKQAAFYLAVAAVLEAEENNAAAEAKRKADADKAALEAEALRDRLNRLEDLATEYFDEPYDYLGAKKKAAVEEIYRLERELDADNDCGCDECVA